MPSMEEARAAWRSTTCPVAGCHDIKASHKHWMCRAHWHLVPYDLQRELSRQRPGWLRSWRRAMEIASSAQIAEVWRP